MRSVSKPASTGWMITEVRFPAVARAALWVCWSSFSISFSREEGLAGWGREVGVGEWWWVVGFSVSVGEMGEVEEEEDDSEVDIVRVRSCRSWRAVVGVDSSRSWWWWWWGMMSRASGLTGARVTKRLMSINPALVAVWRVSRWVVNQARLSVQG